MTDIATIRQRAREHQEELDAHTRYLTAAQIAAKWGCSVDTVYVIPATELPYMVIGSGRERQHRRYAPTDIEAYEAARRSHRA